MKPTFILPSLAGRAPGADKSTATCAPKRPPPYPDPLRQILIDKGDRNAAFPNRRGDALHRAEPDVAPREPLECARDIGQRERRQGGKSRIAASSSGMGITQETNWFGAALRQIERPDLADEVVAERTVGRFAHEAEPRRLIDAPRRDQYVVGP